MESNIIKTERASLLDILGDGHALVKPIKKIEIPIIQRDYAQGRKGDEHITQVRKFFIDSLYNALINEESIDLDYIYGYCTSDRTFIPLDGQQRLTTLFLLHWYIAKHEKVEIPESLKKFSYETRASSRDFINKLLNLFNPSFSYGADKKYESISDEILDQYWSERHWTQTDPTIKSILVMLDTIDKKFSSTSDLWNKLTDKKIIYFYLLILGDDFIPDDNDQRMKDDYDNRILLLSEDIYVKMNARGKELTPFEHFKAYLEGLISQVDEELSKSIFKKFDTDWSDLFLPLLDEDVEPEPIKHSLDNCLFRYYRFIAQILAFKDSSIRNKDSYNDFDLADKLFSKQNESAKQNAQVLYDCFWCWENVGEIDIFFTSIFSNNTSGGKRIRLNTDVNLFTKAIWYYNVSNRWNYTDTLLLWSVVAFLTRGNQQISLEDKRRIRQVRNMVWNSLGNEIRTESMTEILESVESILFSESFPSNPKVLNRRFANEEIEKENFVIQYPDLYPLLCDLEDHELLSGRIGIVGFDFDSFEKRANKFINYFANSQMDENNTTKALGRILSTYGDFSEHIKNDRYKMGGRLLKNWSELFMNYDRDNSTIKQVFCFALDEMKSSAINEWIKEKIELFVSNRTDDLYFDWRYYFAKYPEAFEGKSGIYVWENDYNVRMLDSKQLNGYHRDVYIEMLFGQIGGSENNRWIYGYTNIEDRKLELDNIKLVVYFNEYHVFFRMKRNTKYYNLFEEVCEKDGLIVDEVDHCLWSKPIKKRLTSDGRNYDSEDRILVAKKFYLRILEKIESSN